MNATSPSRPPARPHDIAAPMSLRSEHRPTVAMTFDGVCSTRSVEFQPTKPGEGATTPVEHEIGRVAEPMC